MSNPFLVDQIVPCFSEIPQEQVRAAIEEGIRAYRETLERVAGDARPATWQRVVEPLDEAAERLYRIWAPIRLLNGVAHTPELRRAYDTWLHAIGELESEIHQHTGLYKRLCELNDRGALGNGADQRRQALHRRLRRCRLAGADVAPQARERLRAVRREQRRRQQRFDDNASRASAGWRRFLADERRLDGLPTSVRRQCREAAARLGLDGWLLTLDAGVYRSVLEQAHDRGLRELAYRAYYTRASVFQGRAEWDNGPELVRILRLRAEEAQLLGYANYAELSLASKMAESVADVVQVLGGIATGIRPKAQRELITLTRVARARDGLMSLRPWDIPYYVCRLREERGDPGPETFREFFPLARVLSGLFELFARLFDIRVDEVGNVPTWHPSVRVYALSLPGSAPKGVVFLDAFARPGKRAGAWMDVQATSSAASGLDGRAIAHVVMNLPVSGQGAPALLSHAELLVLVHEFGHALQHVFSQGTDRESAGLHGVEWDAVEIVSQLLEILCWEYPVLALLSGHVTTGQPLPYDMYERLWAGRDDMIALRLLRQVELAMFDLRIHAQAVAPSEASVQAILDAVRAEVAVVIPPASVRVQNGFGHIFSGAYAAGYYGYQWSYVLASDIAERLKGVGLFDQRLGRRIISEIVEPGGSRDAASSFKALQGRIPSAEALLKSHGLDCATA